VKHHPAFFREIFHERRINNIYFDTYNLNYYSDNKVGVSQRKKVRIRWYGEDSVHIKDPVLEVKIKEGLLGEKWQYPISSFELNDKFNKNSFRPIFNCSNLPPKVLELLNHLSPSLSNSYLRRYFETVDKEFRLTIDHSVVFADLVKGCSWNQIHIPEDQNKIIVELKYQKEFDLKAQNVSNRFPFRIDKNSKYVSGIDQFHFLINN